MKKHKISREMLHPELRTVGTAIRAVWPSFSVLKFRFCNLFLDNVGAGLALTKKVRYSQLWLPREDGSRLRLCIYTPIEKKENVPGLLWLHGGGYALGIPEQDVVFIRDFILATGCTVVAPDYTDSPKAPFPAALNDCYRALLWLQKCGAGYGVRSDRLFVGGDSAGGGLTAALTLLARDRGEVAVAFQMPLYPMLDDRMQTSSMRGNDAPVWNEKSTSLAWKLYLGDDFGSDRVSKYAAPARETDYSRLPPTLTYVGTLEPFTDETLQYVENLRSAGTEVHCLVLEGCFHGFDLFSNTTPAREARAFLLEGFCYAATHYTAPQPGTPTEEPREKI